MWPLCLLILIKGGVAYISVSHNKEGVVKVSVSRNEGGVAYV